MNKTFGVYVNSQLMTRCLTAIKAQRLVKEYQAKGLNASWAELV